MAGDIWISPRSACLYYFCPPLRRMPEEGDIVLGSVRPSVRPEKISSYQSKIYFAHITLLLYRFSFPSICPSVRPSGNKFCPSVHFGFRTLTTECLNRIHSNLKHLNNQPIGCFLSKMRVLRFIFWPPGGYL